MKKFKERTVFYTDTFTDFQGKVREFTLCAVVNQTNSNYMIDLDSSGCIYYALNPDGRKYEVNLGIAVRNTDDKFDQVLGETIAKGKAIKKPIETFIVPRSFQTKKSLIENILKAYGEEFKKDPSIYIPGYDKWKEKWNVYKKQAERV